MKLFELFENNIETTAPGVEGLIVVYGGRFQPFHPGHFAAFSWLQNKLGAKNTFIATGNNTDIANKGKMFTRGAKKGLAKPVKSPFNFEEKKSIITTMFNVSPDRVIQSKAPTFNPIEVFDALGIDENRYAVVYAAGDREENSDISRYSTDFFEEYVDQDLSEMYPKPLRAYYVKVPGQAGDVSGTEVRRIMGDPNTDALTKKETFEKLYGRFDKNIFSLFLSKFE